MNTGEAPGRRAGLGWCLQGADGLVRAWPLWTGSLTSRVAGWLLARGTVVVRVPVSLPPAAQMEGAGPREQQVVRLVEPGLKTGTSLPSIGQTSSQSQPQFQEP